MNHPPTRLGLRVALPVKAFKSEVMRGFLDEITTAVGSQLLGGGSQKGLMEERMIPSGEFIPVG